MREYLDSTRGDVQMAFLPPSSRGLNPMAHLWAWLKRHAMANFCLVNLDALDTMARATLESVLPGVPNGPCIGSFTCD